MAYTGYFCEICEERVATSKHHLIPKSYKGKGIHRQTIFTCKPCHLFIHRAFSIRDLALHFNTAKKLKRCGIVREFLSVYSNPNLDRFERKRQVNIVLRTIPQFDLPSNIQV